MATGSIVNAFADFTTQASFPAPTAGDMRVYFKTSDSLPYFKNSGGTETAFATLTSGLVPLSAGGTNAALTASVGGIVYSTASALAILSGTATAGQIVRSGASATPTWSTATYPATGGTAANVLRSDGTNFLSASLAAADLSNGVTGSGAVMLAASPTTTGTLTAAAGTFSSTLGVSGLSSLVGTSVRGTQAPASGSGLELGYGTFGATTGHILAFNRTGAAYLPLQLGGGNANIVLTDSASTVVISGNTSVAGTIRALTANGYLSNDASPGISTTVTTGSLVGKTITFKDGLVTAFA